MSAGDCRRYAGAHRFQCRDLSVIGTPASLGSGSKPRLLMSFGNRHGVSIERSMSLGSHLGKLPHIELIPQNAAFGLDDLFEPPVDLIMRESRLLLERALRTCHSAEIGTRRTNLVLP